MARIYLSPLIVDIRAKQADTVFSKWKGINYIRSRVIPSNPKTPSQISVREALARLVALWQRPMFYEKTNLDWWAKGKSISGFNEWIGANVQAEREFAPLVLCRNNGYDALSVFSAATGSGEGEIDITFAETPVPTGSKLSILARVEDSSVWAKVATYNEGTTSPQTINGLVGATNHLVYGYLRAGSVEDGSEIGQSSYGEAVSGAA